ncbi:formamidopyrimidine-DNA glycosylase-like isoform X2 [Asparagus officinalis]|uniref:formamidopyrimidine-DNA glycosylase-like isoform X2 n=1 Tax=Asparagus officinalis TaxID=4686 RepID=UPI00098DE653|nr:formamidopyrimidine-DNA glycosylase-like isoform X2 [Asparagus officinalis]XP_020262852.1 formamidopyrimidine-DNA glycosylase-like isoform X2 [Asparagus officinalis]XP_020274950.1 formamidopyrimidine-DNA glycosylase-like isoform X2 [Asparagus officinalis]
MKVEEFVDSLSKKKIAIKALLLDQVAATLSKESCETLHRCIKEVANYALEVVADSNSFPIEWLFHFRLGKKSGKVNGKFLNVYDCLDHKSFILQVIEKVVEVGADSR